MLGPEAAEQSENLESELEVKPCEAESEPTPHRSQRSTAEQHSNRHHEHGSVLDTCSPAAISHIIAHLAAVSEMK